MELPFMLQTTTKSTQLYYDNRLNMLQERRGAILHALFATSTSDAAPEMPYFKICVNRERVVEDALIAVDSHFLWFLHLSRHLPLVSMRGFNSTLLIRLIVES